MSGINDEMTESMSIANENNNKGEIGEVDNFDSLDIDFHDTNKIKFFYNYSKRPKITYTYETYTN